MFPCETSGNEQLVPAQEAQFALIGEKAEEAYNEYISACAYAPRRRRMAAPSALPVLRVIMSLTLVDFVKQQEPLFIKGGHRRKRMVWAKESQFAIQLFPEQ